MLNNIKCIEIIKVEIAQINLIPTRFEIIDGVKTTAFSKDKCICVGIPIKEVIPSSANNGVIPSIAGNCIISITAIKRIGTIRTN